jgi:DeoR/GlpR family transcriptional regulator of sugar metabolism
MSIAGVTGNGFFNNNSLVIGPERKMIEASRKVIVVADHTKFGRGAIMHLAPLEIADVVVADSGLAHEYRDLLRARGVEVLIAE